MGFSILELDQYATAYITGSTSRLLVQDHKVCKS